MKRLLGAMLGAMVMAFSGPALTPADAQLYRDHQGWYGAMGAPMQVAAAPSRSGSTINRAPSVSRAYRRRTGRRRVWSRYYAPAVHATRTYRKVWFGNKIVWWPVTSIVPTVRHRSSYRYGSWRPRTAARWSRGHRVYWHPGYWTTAGGSNGPGTWTPEPVYRYNPNGQQPMVMRAAPVGRKVKKGAKTYAGYQYYYYGKPTSALPTPSRTARGSRHRAAAAMSVPHDNIPTVYLYQRGHRQGIHLPPAEAPKPAAAAPQAGKPGAPGAVAPAAGGPLIPGAAPGAPAMAPQQPAVPAPPQTPTSP